MTEDRKQPDWFAVYTRYQHERAVAQILGGKGFEVFLPLYESAHRWKDRVKQLSLPLFPNYVFIRSDLERRGEILSTSGIYGFVKASGWPTAIPVEEIEAVRTVVEKKLAVEPHPYLRAGDRVRVRSGPLEGVEGILVFKKNLFRLILSVDLLARSVAVEVDAADVERLMGRGRGEAQGSSVSRFAVAS